MSDAASSGSSAPITARPVIVLHTPEISTSISRGSRKFLHQVLVSGRATRMMMSSPWLAYWVGVVIWRPDL